MKEIFVQQLKKKLDIREDLQLIDVRESYEFKICRLKNALHIPLDKLPTLYTRIERSKPVVVYCHDGIRSTLAASYLQENHGFHNIYNLEGGIHAWAIEVDTSMLCY